MPNRAGLGRFRHYCSNPDSHKPLTQFVGRNDFDGTRVGRHRREVPSFVGSGATTARAHTAPRLIGSEDDIYGILRRNAKRVLSAFLGIKRCVHFKLRFRNNPGEQPIGRQGSRPGVFWHASYYVKASGRFHGCIHRLLAAHQYKTHPVPRSVPYPCFRAAAQGRSPENSLATSRARQSNRHAEYLFARDERR